MDYLIKNGADLCLKNNAEKSGLQFSLKYLPGPTMKSLENRFDQSIEKMEDESKFDPDVRRKFI